MVGSHKGQGNGTRLTFEQRIMIEHFWNDNKMSTVEIAERLGFTQSTIWRELRKGATTNFADIPKEVFKKNRHGFLIYSAKQGEYTKQKARTNYRGSRKLTFAKQQLIEHHLNDLGWSPEDIIFKYPELDMSPKTIRNYIARGDIQIKERAYGRRRWKQKQEPAKLIQLQKKKALEEIETRVSGADTENPIVLQRLPIELRPKSASNRRVFGHWEVDLVISRDGNKTPIMVLVERKTRYTVIVRLTGKKSNEMIEALDYFMTLHGDFVRSLTFDNGVEFIAWEFLERVQVTYGKKMYFAHPSSPQERGSNEWKNRLIRHYVGYQDYLKMTQLDWDKIADLINNKPMRESLGDKTPNELYIHEALRAKRLKRYKEQKTTK
ncbi:IS30 family transposas [Weissella oryzae SG25]|uniref:IS30 family transposas n=1 Tax=Weissella oryzae (strain DSM 25784 / JCM 18191 / LMG 30913 / SG25) TaxID=1329250 RepID=A0A069D091_WEIOS|nr:IS30 family transposase [Weissella oryzae]GAK30736.1 IS30 family transposas [Weissella oryzae SG25]